MTEALFDVVGSGAAETDAPSELRLRVHVTPGAGRSAVAGRYGDALAVRVAPPPADGRANAACVELIADLFGLPHASVSIVSGERSRDKRLSVVGIDPDEATRRLDEAVSGAGRVGGQDPRRRSRR